MPKFGSVIMNQSKKFKTETEDRANSVSASTSPTDNTNSVSKVNGRVVTRLPTVGLIGGGNMKLLATRIRRWFDSTWQDNDL